MIHLPGSLPSSNTTSPTNAQQKFSHRLPHDGRITATTTPTSRNIRSRFSLQSQKESVFDGLERYVDRIDDILIDPVKCGFLLAFCKMQFCSESIEYLLEVDSFRDMFQEDAEVWNCNEKKWFRIDSELGIHSQITSSMNLPVINLGTSAPLDTIQEVDGNEDNLFSAKLSTSKLFDISVVVIGDESKWPSSVVSFQAISKLIYRIWDEFLSSSAPKQICIPYSVLVNTLMRLRHLHRYGNDVFEETLIDPIKTINRDLFPRFLASKHYENLTKRIAMAFPLPLASELSVRYPSKSAVLEWDNNSISVSNLAQVPVMDMLHDYVLYHHFLVYSKKNYFEENLLFGRSLAIYDCLWKSLMKANPSSKQLSSTEEIDDHVWTLYRFFIAPQSVYEVSLSGYRRKFIMHNLAEPTRDLFQIEAEEVFKILRQYYDSFTKTIEFSSLPNLIIQKKDELSKGNNSKSNTCAIQ